MITKTPSQLEYRGSVKITTSARTHKYHNSGTFNLFEIFMKALIGDAITSDMLPTYIDIREFNSNASILSRPIPITKQVKVDARYGYICVMNASVKLHNLNSLETQTPNSSLRLCLLADNSLSNQNKNILAELSIDGVVINQIISGRHALIEWTLSVSNSEGD